MAEIRTSIAQATTDVLTRIYQIYAGRESEAYQIARRYAAMIMADFYEIQTSVGLQAQGEFWTNRSGRAANAWYAKAYRVGQNVGFYASHGVNVRDPKTGEYYPPALEDWVSLKKNSGDTSTQIMIDSVADAFLADIETLYGGSF